MPVELILVSVEHFWKSVEHILVSGKHFWMPENSILSAIHRKKRQTGMGEKPVHLPLGRIFISLPYYENPLFPQPYTVRYTVAMLAKLISEILAETPESQEVEVRGWVRTSREMKNLVFVEVNDGSCFAGIQCTFDRNAQAFPAETNAGLANLSTGASVAIKGKLISSPASGQSVEVSANLLKIIGEAPAENRSAESACLEIPAYPLQKKTPLPGISAGNCPPQAPYQYFWRGNPYPQPHGLCHPPVFLRTGLSVY
jgi:hypothetical protein